MYISASAPDAPPFSDTTIGCFIRLFFWIAACIMRAIWSEAPPAPAATTISTGLVGSQAAEALPVASGQLSAAAPRRRHAVNMVMAFLLGVRDCRFSSGFPMPLFRGLDCLLILPEFKGIRVIRWPLAGPSG